jgi:cytochrome c
MLKQIQGKWLVLGGLVVIVAVALFAMGTRAGAESKSDAMVMAKANPCNPCAAKAKMNPCNPCAAKQSANPCAARNPCNPCGGGKVDAKMVTRPAGTSLHPGDHMQLVAEGKQLWADNSLGTSGLACGNCHINYGNLNKTFLEPYPHYVAMPHQQAGLQQVSADEMVQFCMIVPMAGKPLAWDSRELAALAAYTEEVQKEFKAAVAANPCMIKTSVNPCNPCAAKAKANPCNPCAAKKNPCNPCQKTR